MTIFWYPGKGSRMHFELSCTAEGFNTCSVLEARSSKLDIKRRESGIL